MRFVWRCSYFNHRGVHPSYIYYHQLASVFTVVSIKPQSHRIVRFFDRAIGRDLTELRPISNVCYDLQQWSYIAIAL